MAQLRLWVARLAAPAALLLAGTVVVLLIRSALESDDGAGTTTGVTIVTTEPTTTQARPTPPPAATAQPEAEFYTVESGDTLETIADQFGTTVEELLALNPDVDPVELSIGQRIRVQ